MTWFVLFAITVFGLYFWRQYTQRQRELNSPFASHRSGHSHIGAGRWCWSRVCRTARAASAWAIATGAIRGPNLPPGAKARVTGVDGTVLLVDRVAA